METKTQTPNLPPAYNLIPSLNSPKSLHFHQILILLLTFTSYATFHASRKPPSIVKSVLGPESPEFNTNTTQNHTGWPPFDGKQGTHRLGELDLAFLSSYAIGMYFAGHFGDRIDLRFFLTFGMMGSGVMTVVFGFGYWFGIHKLGFFMVVQIVSGLFQSIGWPCVISVIGNWFGKSKRGLIMGIWSSNTSVGNIIGSVVASSVLEFGWGWSFVVPGMMIVVVGVFVFMFLVVNPEDAGFESPGKEIEMSLTSQVEDEENVEKGDKEDEVGLIQSDSLNVESIDSVASTSAIGFLEAWKLPGVAPYAFCLFFSKLVAYTFLYWLPFYIRHTEVAGVRLSHKTAGILSTMFDLGGVVGGISAGYISDAIEARAVTSIAFLFFSIPALVLYRVYGSISMHTNIGLMLLSGLLVNGPYALITTAVAADLGTQSVIKGNSRALATVTAIIDGTGSVGAALGPLLTGYISSRGWNSVFAMLIVSIFCAGLFLILLAKAEITSKISEKKWFWQTS